MNEYCERKTWLKDEEKELLKEIAKCRKVYVQGVTCSKVR